MTAAEPLPPMKLIKPAHPVTDIVPLPPWTVVTSLLVQLVLLTLAVPDPPQISAPPAAVTTFAAPAPRWMLSAPLLLIDTGPSAVMASGLDPVVMTLIPTTGSVYRSAMPPDTATVETAV